MPQQPTITTMDNATSVDWTEYDLNIELAAGELQKGNSIVVKEFGDYTSEFIDEVDPYPETLEAEHFKGNSLEEIIDRLRMYEFFGSIKTTPCPPYTNR